jgi:hypothetical protein
MIRIDGGCSHMCRVRMCGAEAGDFGAGGLAGGFDAGGLVDFDLVDFGWGRGGVGGDLPDHVGVLGELDAADVADGGVEGAENEFGALDFDGAAEQGVDDLDEGGLDGLLVLEEGGVMDAGVGAFDGAEHALMEVAELLSAESGGAAGDSGDFDVSAVFDVGHIGPLGAGVLHFGSSNNFFVVAS